MTIKHKYKYKDGNNDNNSNKRRGGVCYFDGTPLVDDL